MSNLLPILKNRQEQYAQKERGMFVEELFGNENSPIIMYGIDKGDYMEYSQSVGNEEDEKIKQQAISNLQNLEVHFEVQKMEGFNIALCQHEYAAEKIIDKTFMKRIGVDLGSNSIVVGIPMKGFLVAVAKGKGEENLYGAVKKQYENAQTYPISNSLYYVVNGEIEMMGTEGSSGKIGDENSIMEISGKNDSRGKVGFVAKVGHKTEDELANQIQTAFQNIILLGMKDAKNFNGKIDFHIDPSFNLLSASLEERIKKMAKNISERGAVQLMGGLSGEEFKVRFFYGEDKFLAETIETEPVQLKNESINEETTTKVENSEIKYADLSHSQLDQEFWKIISIPNARTNIDALTRMSELMAEYKKRGLAMPDSKPKQAKKSWWRFW